MSADPSSGRALITGGAGFIGTNLASRLLDRGESVLVFDSLQRPGVDRNLRWLRSRHGERLAVELADIRDQAALRRTVERASSVFHLAAQVAVTTSLRDPRDDFEVNAQGTLALLEALRRLPDPPPLLYTSTNKVYGGLDDVPLSLSDGRYWPREAVVAANGIGEERPLDFHSPYGCSKGCADQYVIDYARTFGLPTAVFRMSCIYGPHQLGTEDQGWIAHFILRALEREPIVVYGDGRQVRDALHVDDLVDAMLLARERIATVAGQAFNVGGGPANALSLLELVGHIGELGGFEPLLRFGPWRQGDQRYYVTDTRRVAAALGWAPRVSVRQGVTRLFDWLVARDAPGAASDTVAVVR